MKSICIIANGYPTKDNPEYAFIRPVAHGFADNGIECTVIAPQSKTNIILGRKRKRPLLWYDTTEQGNKVKVIQPKAMTFSLTKLKGTAISSILTDNAVRKAIRKYNLNPDVFYGHFWECGMTAAKVCKGKPVYVACGESEIWVYQRYSKEIVDKLLPRINGVICVSTKNKTECQNMGLLKDNPRVVVLPNGIDSNEFYNMPQEEARKKLGIDPNCLIASFVGAFIERKGVLRLVEAARKIPELKLILVGAGDQKPESDQILFAGRLPHEDIVTYLNASDMFVLPTQAEGCCNAIVEAMACGLPIISSNLSFNDDILDNSNSIRIDPNSVDEISNAIYTLHKDIEVRRSMSEASLSKARKFTIEQRVNSIIQFIGEKI